MAVRNLTGKFEEARALVRSRRAAGGIEGGTSTSSSSSMTGGGAGGIMGGEARAVKDPLLSGGSASAGSSGLSSDIISLRHQLPPDWVNLVERVQAELKKATEFMRDLRKLHDERLKVMFGDKEAEQERDIEEMTAAITRILKGCEGNLKRIATIGTTAGQDLPPEEKAVRLNVMRALGSQLSTMSREFRKSQKEFIAGLSKGQEDVGITLFDQGASGSGSSRSGSRITLDEAIDRGLTGEQVAQLDVLRRTASERDKEIIRIAQSVQELAQIFKELNMLVIEQGSVLDRIDYNIQSALTKVEEGVVHVRKADEYSKKALKLKCIMCLCVVLVILIFAYIIKKS